MTELVIDVPHLQTPGQRLATTLLSLSGWLLWGYLFLPLLFLCGWWLGVQTCSFWVNLCGGYLGLQQLLTLYGCTVVGLTFGWATWVSMDGLHHPKPRRTGNRPAAVVTDAELSRFFVLPEQVLGECRRSRITTVEFDRDGKITGLIPLAD